MTDAFRYNRWGEWRPVFGSGPQERFLEVTQYASALSPPALRAVYLYCAYSGYLGIEFVLLTHFSDPMPQQTFDDIQVVPCWPPSTPDDGTPFQHPPWYLYDGWLPIQSSTPAHIHAGLARIDQFVTALSFLYRSPTRWIPKYIEAVRQHPRREIGDEDRTEVSTFLVQSDRLSPELRSALHRTLHWYQHAQQTANEVERFLSLYYALEGLLLSLYEHGPDVQLPLAGRASKKVRRERQATAIRDILGRLLESDPVRAVEEAYFTAVTPIRRRVDEVAKLIAGPQSDFVAWLHNDSVDAPSPATLRSGLVHGRFRSTDPAVQERLGLYSDRIDNAIRLTVARLLAGQWLGDPPPARQLRYTVSYGVLDQFWWADGAATASGDFSITLDLLARKGIL